MTQRKLVRGWVYVMTNKSMPGLVKVGASGKDPFERAKELAGTHSPNAFIVEYDVLVYDFFSLEKAVHQRLSSSRVKGDGQGAEFFRCSVNDAVIAIRELVKGTELSEAFHQLDRQSLVEQQRKIEQENANKIVAAKHAELARKKLEEEQRRAEADERERLRVENEQRLLAKIKAEEETKRRNEWVATQIALIKELSGNKLSQDNAMKAFSAGTFAYCPSCKRPRIEPYRLESNSVCLGCGKVLGVPF